MTIVDGLPGVETLEAFGVEATRLLCEGDFATLAERFGYALAYDRDPAIAIREELACSLEELGATALGEAPSTPPTVSWFEPNDTGLLALVEQRIPTDNGRDILLELILASNGTETGVYLEEVSAVG
ncbi:hypothetical protein ACQQ2N_06160 [Dokdonella sp. MW10]|uniref:hypothetical protein n=1 Tax=Dokdonella sp. MW10 TaxID=2992926 RepID=UPI003F7DDD9B